MSDVFISYSRRDKEFAAWLHESLIARGKDVWIDVEDIRPSAAWLDEILAAIESAGAVIFLLSPEAAASEVCQQEIDRAVSLHKRLIPVVCRAVSVASVAAPIRALQWIDFTGPRDRAALFDTLVATIDADLDWVKLHTHLVERASEWERGGRNTALLLRGVSLQEAEAWLAKGPEKDPKPSSLQTRYITESRKYATRVQRYIMGGVSAGLVVAIVLAVIAFLQRNAAIEQRKIAEERLQMALARDLAARATMVQEQQGRLLPRSILLAVESVRRSPSLQATLALTAGVRMLTATNRTFKHPTGSNAVSFSPDGGFIASAGDDGTARVWRIADGNEILRAPHGRRVSNVAFSPDGKYLASAGGFDGTAKLWELAGGNDGKKLAAVGDNAVIWDVDRSAELARITVPAQNTFGQFLSVVFAPDGQTFATAGLDGQARCWRVSDGKMLADFRHEASVLSVAYSSDSRFLATGSEDKLARIWEIASGREVLRQEYKDWADAVAFSPDGRLFAAGSRDHSVRIEPWRIPDLIEQACTRLGMSLTADEWREYLPNETYRPTCPETSRRGMPTN